jgi:hypothetical protein
MMKLEVCSAVAMAVFAALASIGLLLRALHRRRTGRFHGAALLPSLAGLLLAWPCLFLGIVVGGDFGGALGEELGYRIGLGETPAFIAIGIGLGIWLVTTLPELLLVGLVGIAVLRNPPSLDGGEFCGQKQPTY